MHKNIKMILPLAPSFTKKRWVYKLADLGLDPLKIIDDEGREYDKDSGRVGNLVAPNIIVSEEIEKSDIRKYALFDSYAQVHKYCVWIRNTGKIPHLYELCPYFTKLHFDIDVSKKDVEEDVDFSQVETTRDEKILLPFLKYIESVFAKLYPLNYSEGGFVDNMLVFEAHRQNEKISYHIVVDGFHVPCHESWLFYKEVTDSMSRDGLEIPAKYADFSVYKKNQNFRLFGSNKSSMRGSAGIKQIYKGADLELSPGKVFSATRMMESSFGNEPYNKELLMLRVLERSLISHTMGTVRLTLNKTSASDKNRQAAMGREDQTYSRTITLKDENVKRIMEVFERSSFFKTETGEPAFEFDKVAPGDLVCVKRIRKSFCSICERTHEGQNSWLERDILGNVHFVCRRAQEARIKGGYSRYIGNCSY
jgi:hypothetical protein